MAKPNYSYEKRQRELQKKKKKEDKLARKNAPPATDQGQDQDPNQPAEPAPEPPKE
jgi:hypothetical protein